VNAKDAVFVKNLGLCVAIFNAAKFGHDIVLSVPGPGGTIANTIVNYRAGGLYRVGAIAGNRSTARAALMALLEVAMGPVSYAAHVAVH
jgi:hypothetical protein